MLLFLFMLGVVGGLFIPFQTSVNSRLSMYTESPIYASTISFAVGSLFLIIVNIVSNPHMMTVSYFSEQKLNFYWLFGGLLGVVFLTGNLILLPRLGASLTVVITLTGQMIMGVLIDTFGWLGSNSQPFTIFKFLGIILLIFSIFLMNYVRDNTYKEKQPYIFIWLSLGLIFGFGPPLQTTINSLLGEQLNSNFMASLISFVVGFIILLIMTLIFNKSFYIKSNHNSYGKLRLIHFIGGVFGVIFITVNIFLMPYLGAAVTTISGMLGQMIMALIIDHFGLLGTPKNQIDIRKTCGIIGIIIGIILLRFF